MKKVLLLSSVALAAVGLAKAEVIEWDFNTHGIFAAFQDEEDPFNYRTGNYDFIDKYGMTVNTDGEQMCYKGDDGAWYPVLNRLISFYDGLTYMLEAEENEYGYEVFSQAEDQEVLNHPFFSWYADAEQYPQMNEESVKSAIGPSRFLWMIGWGSLDAWSDDNYNAIDEATWISTKHGIAFNRNGNSASRQGSYVQFPAIEGPFTMEYYIGTAGGSYAAQLRCFVEVVDAEKWETVATELVAEDDFTAKRYYKKTYTYNGTDKVCPRIACDGMEVYIMHVVFNNEDSNGITSIAADVEQNAPAYNILGMPVNSDYKGIVIKNGQKFIQR